MICRRLLLTISVLSESLPSLIQPLTQLELLPAILLGHERSVIESGSMCLLRTCKLSVTRVGHSQISFCVHRSINLAYTVNP